MESGNGPNMSNTQKQDHLLRAFQRFMDRDAASGDAGLPVANAPFFPVASGSANAGMQFDGTLVAPPTGAAQSAPSGAPTYALGSAAPARPPPVLAQAANPAPPSLALPAIAAAGSAPGTAPRPPPPPAVHPRAPVHLAYANQNGRQLRSLAGRRSGSGNGRAMTLGFSGASGTNDVSTVPLDSVTVSCASAYAVYHSSVSSLTLSLFKCSASIYRPGSTCGKDTEYSISIRRSQVRNLPGWPTSAICDASSS